MKSRQCQLLGLCNLLDFINWYYFVEILELPLRKKHFDMHNNNTDKKYCFFTFIRVVIKILCRDHLHPNPSFLKLLPYFLSFYSGAASAPDFESAAYGSVLYFLEAVLPFLETFYRDFYYPDQSTYSNEIDETDHMAKAVVVCSISRGRNIHCIFNAIILILNMEIPVFCDLPRKHLNRVI